MSELEKEKWQEAYNYLNTRLSGRPALASRTIDILEQKYTILENSANSTQNNLNDLVNTISDDSFDMGLEAATEGIINTLEQIYTANRLINLGDAIQLVKETIKVSGIIKNENKIATG